MTPPREADRAAHLLRRNLETPAPLDPKSRGLGLDAVRSALTSRQKRRSRSRAIGSFAAAAAIVGLSIGAWSISRPHETVAAPANPSIAIARAHPSGEGATVSVAGQGHAVSEDSELPQGSRVVAHAGGRVALDFATGTHITVEEGGDLFLEQTGPTQKFVLEHGTIEAHVAKLIAGQRFLIETADAEVEVKGTAFRVDVIEQGACGAHTRVTVSEGVVVVRHDGVENRVPAGSVWPPGCTTASNEKRNEPVAVAARPVPQSVSTASILAAQNDLFDEGISAKRRGDVPRAIAAFDRYLAKYPDGPLAENAAAEKLRLLRTSDAALAKEAARQYLARWPNGFARADANAILGD